MYDFLDQVSKFMYLCIDWLIDELFSWSFTHWPIGFCRYAILHPVGYLVFCMQAVLLSSTRKTKKRRDSVNGKKNLGNYKATSMQVCANGVEREGFLEKVRLKLYPERNDDLLYQTESRRASQVVETA